MLTEYKILGFQKVYNEEAKAEQLQATLLNPAEIQKLGVNRKVQTLFKMHLFSTLAVFFYSVYSTIPRIFPNIASKITFNFRELYQSKNLLVTVALGASLALHVLLINRQNKAEYLSKIKTLCEQKLQANQCTAFCIETFFPRQYYIYSKDRSDIVRLSCVDNINNITNHIKNDLPGHRKNDLPEYQEVFLSNLIARRS